MSFKYLFIIESPGKQKKIQNYLGKEYKVIATKGHISDLPKKKLGINIRKNFEAVYEVYPEKKNLVKEIKELAKKADIVYLAMDLDREGAVIAQRVIDILPPKTVIKRVRYNAITKKEILEAIANATNCLDIDLVYSAETRRFLDRLVGYKCSYITKQATGGKSAGRVQSAALRIIAEREKEIKSFIPKEYWPIEALLENEKGEQLVAKIKTPNKLKITNKKQAEEICKCLKNKDIIVSKYEKKQVSSKPYPPFTTSTMYQSASAIFGWGSKKTAKIAQQVYENSWCTYIRSDSTFIVPEFVNDIRNEIPSKYGKKYLPEKRHFYSNKKNAQEAHEAIRVTDIALDSVPGGDTNKLYTLIWKRTISSQMEKLEQIKGSAEFKCDKYKLSASGSKIIFDGWRKAWDYGKLKDEYLPELKEGEKMKVIEVCTEQKWTQPPPRYTESSIVKELEKSGIGRPSTYASIIDILFTRDYVKKEKKALCATDIGINVSDFLQESGFCFIDLQFTAQLEEKLDKIANKETTKLDTLKDFWKRLKSDIENAKKIKQEKSRSGFKCPKCKGELLLKHSNYGSFFSCENYNNKENKCDYKADVGKDGEPKEKQKKEIKESNIKCPNCGEYLLVRTSKKNNEYLGCRNWKNAKCKGFYTLEGEKMEFKKKKKRKYKK